MFEEIAVWVRKSPTVAVRYIGFRRLEDNRCWIALGAYVGGDEEAVADDVVAAQAILDSFLDDLPQGPEEWKSTVADAVEHFIANNPDGY
jgi:hypothetical protein